MRLVSFVFLWTLFHLKIHVQNGLYTSARDYSLNLLFSCYGVNLHKTQCFDFQKFEILKIQEV